MLFRTSWWWLIQMLLLLLVLLCLLLLLLVLRFCVFAALATQGPNQTRTVDELCVQQLLLPGVIRAIAQLAQAARPQAQWAIVVQFTHTRRMRNVGMAGEPSERPRSRRNLLTQRRSNNLLTSRDTATNASQPDGRTDVGHFAICYTADRQRRPVQRQEIRPEARSQRDKQTRESGAKGISSSLAAANSCCLSLVIRRARARTKSHFPCLSLSLPRSAAGEHLNFLSFDISIIGCSSSCAVEIKLALDLPLCCARNLLRGTRGVCAMCGNCCLDPKRVLRFRSHHPLRDSINMHEQEAKGLQLNLLKLRLTGQTAAGVQLFSAWGRSEICMQIFSAFPLLEIYLFFFFVFCPYYFLHLLWA